MSKKLLLTILAISSAILLIAAFNMTSEKSDKGHFVELGKSRVRGEHEAIKLEDGSVLLTGYTRETWEVAKNPELKKTTYVEDIYDPQTQRFSPNSNSKRYKPKGSSKPEKIGEFVVALNDGRQLIIKSTTASLYNPVTKDFDWQGKLHYPYPWAGTLLKDGRVLLTGGHKTRDAFIWACEQEKGAEVFDPVTQTLMVTGDLQIARYGHQATLLDNGEVLITGGRDAESCDSGYPLYSDTNIAELYIPAQEN